MFGDSRLRAGAPGRGQAMTARPVRRAAGAGPGPGPGPLSPQGPGRARAALRPGDGAAPGLESVAACATLVCVSVLTSKVHILSSLGVTVDAG